MKQKFLVINCNENDVEDLRLRLGGRHVISCESLDDVVRYLPSSSTAVLVSEPTSHVNGHNTMQEVVSSPNEVHEVSELIERVIEQNNGHAKTLAARVDMLEQKIIEYSLNRNGQHRKETAAELGISRVTLYNKMKKFGLLG